MQALNTFFYVLVLILSVVVHEVAHGFAADSQGDPTARYAGRLTLNPLKHLDMVGSVLLPILLVVFNAGFVIGWAKPVPYTESNLRNKRWGTILVAGAGIMVNIGLAVIFGLGIRFSFIFGSFAPAFVAIATIITLVNIVLALFNLIPIPPLDGSKILFALLPNHAYRFQRAVEYVSLPLLLLFIFVLWPQIISPAIGHIFVFITGLPVVFS
jgi:Zn-dependent protease